jgi:hypothetical protein
MRRLLPIGLTWLFLVLLTLLSAEALSARQAILIIAGVKSALIGSEFMELRHAHRGLQIGFALWLVVIVASLCIL